MKSRLLFATATVGLSTLLAMPVRVAAQEAEQQKAAHFQHYTVTDLGVLGTGTNSSGFDMNRAGWVGGSSNLVPGGPQHAFLWYDGDR